MGVRRWHSPRNIARFWREIKDVQGFGPRFGRVEKVCLISGEHVSCDGVVVLTENPLLSREPSLNFNGKTVKVPRVPRGYISPEALLRNDRFPVIFKNT